MSTAAIRCNSVAICVFRTTERGEAVIASHPLSFATLLVRIDESTLAMSHSTNPTESQTTADRASVVRLVLAESYPLFLEGMAQVLASEPGFHVLARCSTGDDVLRAVERHRPDVLILDLEISDGAKTIIETLRDDGSLTRVIALAADLNEQRVIEAIQLGVRGLLLKNMAPHLLTQCIRKVHAGALWYEKESMSRALAQMVDRDASYRKVASVLTPREIEVVRLVAAGR